jgi:hypothetical protein
MSDRRTTHWQFFNFAGRLVGAWFVFGGVIFIIYGFASGGAEFVIPGLVVGVLGVLLILAKPYRPDLDDSAKATDSDKKTD